MPTLSKLRAIYDKLPTIEAGILWEDIEDIYKAYNGFKSYAPIIEIGFCKGVSAAVLSNLKDVITHYYSIDPYVKDYVKDPFAHFSTYSRQWLTMIEEPSAYALPVLKKGNVHPDLIFIDGSHQFADKFVDVYWANEIAQKGCIVALHDPWLPQTMQIISFIDGNYKHWTKISQSQTIAIYQVTSKVIVRRWDAHTTF